MFYPAIRVNGNNRILVRLELTNPAHLLSYSKIPRGNSPVKNAGEFPTANPCSNLLAQAISN